MGFTVEQLRVLAIIPHVTGFLSVAGSGWIMFEVLRDRTKWRKTYHRLLFVMSFFDCFTSAAFALSTIPIPRGTAGVYNPRGTTATCTAQGFFIQMSIIGPMYNCMLALYYVLLIRRNVPERTIATKIEPYMHATCWVLAFAMGVCLLFMNMFNSATLWCWQNDYPSNCEGSYGEPGPVPCERGRHAWLFRWVFYYALLWLILLVSAVLMFRLYSSVHRQTKRLHKFDSQLNMNSLSDEEKRKLKKSSKYNKRSRKVASQAFFFMGAFVLTFLAGSMNRLTQLVSGKSLYPLLVLHCVFAPAQGFLNFLVYMRPKAIKRWTAWKKSRRDQEKSRRDQEGGMTDGSGGGGRRGSFWSTLATELEKIRRDQEKSRWDQEGGMTDKNGGGGGRRGSFWSTLGTSNSGTLVGRSSYTRRSSVDGDDDIVSDELNDEPNAADKSDGEYEDLGCEEGSDDGGEEAKCVSPLSG